jgi:hypothetical protein
MKNKTLLLIGAFALSMLGTTSCTKENIEVDTTLISEETRQEMQTAIVGSWQFVEKGVEIAMHDGHICNDPSMAADKISYTTQWGKVSTDEKRTFKPNGNVSLYENATLSCDGTYTISNNGALDIKATCQNAFGKIETLTNTLLIVREGTVFYKFQKLD